MSELNIKNERIKRKYIKWMREARGFSEATISAIEKAVCLFEDFTQRADFGTFSQKSAVGFKKWLVQNPEKSRQISITTAYHYLRHLKTFLVWLSGQPGYRSKIGADDISYLCLDRKKVMEATTPKRVDCPSLGHVKRLAESIRIANEIDRRDQALISFLLLSGMRDTAVSSLPLGCFDSDTFQVRQEPSQGVKTKFGKSIVTTLFEFDDQLLSFVLNWVEYLAKQKGFSGVCPMFPRSKVGHVDGGLSFVSREVEAVFWKGAGPIRRILRKRSVETDLPYFNPHSFRHSAVQLAMKRCRTAEEMKAVSQNLGHEYVGTTLTSYGKVDEYRVAEVIRKLDFSDSDSFRDRTQQIEKIRKMLDGLE